MPAIPPPMFSLKKLLGKDDKFFDLLEAGAEEAKISVDRFAATLEKIAAAGQGVVLYLRQREHSLDLVNAELGDDARPAGELQAAGETWSKWDARRGLSALTRKDGPTTVIVLGSIPSDQLEQFSSAKIESVKVTGSTGTFVYRLRDLKVNGKVAKEGGPWKVSCCVPGQES